MEKIKEEFNLLTVDLEKRYKEMKDTMERNFAVRGDNFKKMHLEELSRMKSEFEDGLRVMEQKYANLNNK